MAVCLSGAVAGALLYWSVYYGKAWVDSDSANLRSLASTISQIASGLSALMFAGVTLLLALPESTGLGLLKTSGHFFDLCARMALAMIILLLVVVVGLVLMMVPTLDAKFLCLLVSFGVTGLISMLGCLHKLVILILFVNKKFDPDYIDDGRHQG